MADPEAAIFQRLDQNPQVNYTRSEYIRRVLWQLVQATLFRLPLPRSYGWRRFWLKRFGAVMGKNAAVHPTTRIIHPWLLEMGDWTMIGPGVTVYNLGKVTLGHQSVISQQAYICAGTHDYTRPEFPLLRPEVHIGAGVWIAACAFVGPGVTIGDNTVIGACAVVTGDIPAGVVAAGNPCRVIKPRPMTT
jgi:putative colanic acid biosynthesis acetyltransferase WcaF